MTVAYSVYELSFPNGKKYIGISKNVDKRWANHRFHSRNGDTRPLYNAMRKYGSEKVNRRVLLVGVHSYVKEMEIAIIRHFNTRVPNGYNVSFGGDLSPAITQEVREKIRASKLVHWQDEEYRQRISKFASEYSYTEEQRRQQSVSSFRKWENPDYRAKQSAAHSGKVFSTETRERMGLSLQRAWKSRSQYGRSIFKQHSGRYSARMGMNGVRHRLGTFDTIEQAQAAIDAFRKQNGL